MARGFGNFRVGAHAGLGRALGRISPVLAESNLTPPNIGPRRPAIRHSIYRIFCERVLFVTYPTIEQRRWRSDLAFHPDSV